jgi:SNF2 family DNA or RNA helicase
VHPTLRVGVSEFAKMKWSACIFDEAHKLKNKKTALYEAAMKLPVGRRIGLTGTIMQNSYDELYYLMDWACPGSLGQELREFKDHYSKKMQSAQRFDVVGLGLLNVAVECRA